MCPKVTNMDGTFRFIGIQGKNREEWVLTDYAGLLSGIASVPLYETLGKDSTEYILNES